MRVALAVDLDVVFVISRGNDRLFGDIEIDIEQVPYRFVANGVNDNMQSGQIRVHLRAFGAARQPNGAPVVDSLSAVIQMRN